MNTTDKRVVRELAKQYMEFAASEKQAKAFARMRDNNDLIPGRPPVLIDEIPWYQMDIGGELTCVCEDPWLRGIEYGFRLALFYFRHFSCVDNLYEPFFRINKTVRLTDIGVSLPNYEFKRTDEYNNIISRELTDVLEDESCLEKFRLPECRLDPEADKATFERVSELLGDVMPVKLCGFGPYSFNAWDTIAYLRGIEAIMIDCYDRPEYLLAIMEKYTAYADKYLDFLEENMEPDRQALNMHCTPAIVSGLGDGLEGTWFRDNAQPLSNVSPSMFYEFAIAPVIKLASRFRYTYYGCCEPLDDKFEAVKKIPNLRKIGCSPWASVKRMAESVKGDYVLAKKPNPAHVAIKTDPELIRRETVETVEACLKNGCPYELVLKDISTVSNDPYNLIIWADTVSDVLDGYYGEG